MMKAVLVVAIFSGGVQVDEPKREPMPSVAACAGRVAEVLETHRVGAETRLVVSCEITWDSML